VIKRSSFQNDQAVITPNGSRRSATGRRLPVTAAPGQFIFACVFLVLSTLLGCGAAGGGSGPSGAAVDAAISVDPVYLEPGLTSATLGWTASEGAVNNYMVFEARNGSMFQFSTITDQPAIQISGEAGDRVQITVIAVNSSGDMSEPSPPSPPVIFQEPMQAAAARAVSLGGALSAPGPALDPSEQTLADTNDSANNDQNDDTEDSTQEDDATKTRARLAQSVRALLLGGDTRLPQSGLTTPAQSWLQAHVDAEMVAGVSLAGTGRSNADDLREIVWRDQSGQLFLSDGAAALETEDLPSTFEEALRLRATERFVGLADFDGDGRGDWLIEDTATGENWIVNGANATINPATGSLDTALAGYGDFDGDGRAELLWQTEDGFLSLTRPGDLSPSLTPLDVAPEGFALLAVADFDGDGRDDLLGRGANGGLTLAMTPASPFFTDSVVLKWRLGSQDLSDALDLVATVDVDEDGAAEIAWLNGDTVEIWNAVSGFESRIAL
jgi:hypothetical protein